MIDTAVVTTDLDRLAERVERAATLVQELRAKLAQAEAEKTELARRLEAEKDELTRRLGGEREEVARRLETEKAELARRLEDQSQKLQGNEPAALVTEVAALRKEQREWVAERKDVAGRIESLLKKLERIEL